MLYFLFLFLDNFLGSFLMLFIRIRLGCFTFLFSLDLLHLLLCVILSFLFNFLFLLWHCAHYFSFFLLRCLFCIFGALRNSSSRSCSSRGACVPRCSSTLGFVRGCLFLFLFL